jgi:hypothetical protein
VRFYNQRGPAGQWVKEGQQACCCWLLLAESHLTRRRFACVLRRIAALPLPAGWQTAAEGKPTGRKVTLGDGKVPLAETARKKGVGGTLGGYTG